MSFDYNIIYNRSDYGDNDDSELALNFVEHLERTVSGWGFKGYYADRDAIPGRNVFGELFRIVSETERTLVVITPEFRSNFWAKYSKQAAFKYLLEEGNQHKLIPIAINIPNRQTLGELNVNEPIFIKGLTEREWKNNNKNGFERLKKAFQSPVPDRAVEEIGDNRLRTEGQQHLVTQPSSLSGSVSVLPEEKDSGASLQGTSTSDADSMKTWENVVECGTEDDGLTLLELERIPTVELLEKVCDKFGRKSKLANKCCEVICKDISRQLKTDFDILPSYKSDSGNKIFFVVYFSEKSTLSPVDFIEKLKHFPYDYVLKGPKHSPEAKSVFEEELKMKEVLSNKDMTETGLVINKNSDDLLDSHSNLTMISASPFKSKDYLKSHTMSKEVCIVLYVTVKGYIPLNEKPFPKTLGTFSVDVREGRPVLLFERDACKIHRHLKMGCQISGESGDAITLGGFVEHKDYNLCALTCAHGLLSNESLKATFENGTFTQHDEEGIFCYQPCYQPTKKNKCGYVVNAKLKPGGVVTENSVTKMKSGVDCALIKVVQNRKPQSGDFPRSENYGNIGYGRNNPMTYSSGKVIPSEDIHLKIIVKFGAKTGPTLGKFRYSNGVIRLQNTDVQYKLASSSHINLKNMMEIFPLHEEVFSDTGDSGALVFAACDNNELKCIGMLVSNFQPVTYVSSIYDVLEELDISISDDRIGLKSFEVHSNGAGRGNTCEEGRKHTLKPLSAEGATVTILEPPANPTEQDANIVVSSSSSNEDQTNPNKILQSESGYITSEDLPNSDAQSSNQNHRDGDITSMLGHDLQYEDPTFLSVDGDLSSANDAVCPDTTRYRSQTTQDEDGAERMPDEEALITGAGNANDTLESRPETLGTSKDITLLSVRSLEQNQSTEVWADSLDPDQTTPQYTFPESTNTTQSENTHSPGRQNQTDDVTVISQESNYHSDSQTVTTMTSERATLPIVEEEDAGSSGDIETKQSQGFARQIWAILPKFADAVLKCDLAFS